MKQTGYPFPNIPRGFNEDEKRFAIGLRYLFDKLFGQQITAKDLVKLTEIYPVGAVVLSTDGDNAPFSFGTWTAVTTGISGVYGWERTE